MDPSLEKYLLHLPMASVKDYASQSLELSHLVLQHLEQDLRVGIGISVEMALACQDVQANRVTPMTNKIVYQLEMTLGERAFESLVDQVGIRPQRLAIVTKAMGTNGSYNRQESSVLCLSPRLDSYPNPAVEELATEEDSTTLGTQISSSVSIEKRKIVLTISGCKIGVRLEFGQR